MANADKPIDRWLAYAAIAVGVILYLAPKSPAVVIGCVILIFGLLAYPIWNFWIIEDALWRRLLALLLLASCSVGLAAYAWPPPPTLMYLIPGFVLNDNVTRAYGLQFQGDQPLFKVAVLITDVDAINLAKKENGSGSSINLFERYSFVPLISNEEEIDPRHNGFVQWYYYRPFNLSDGSLDFQIRSRDIDTIERLGVYQNGVPHSLPSYYVKIEDIRTGKLLKECISDARYRLHDKSKSKLPLCCGDIDPQKGIYASCAPLTTRVVASLKKFLLRWL